jgi:hypothetical protein
MDEKAAVLPLLKRADLLRAAFYIAVLLWVNFYIARDFFSGQTAYMNSMHGFWIAMARRGSGWFRPAWWPYWDCGIPFEAAYAPLVPGLTAAWAALLRVSYGIAFSSVTGIAYLLAPVSLFLLAWGLTRAAGTSFFAALFYSLTSPTQILVPDGDFRWSRIREARRLFLVAAWDDTPHLTALALLPLAMLFLVLAVVKRRRIYAAAAAVIIAVMTTASAFGPVMAALAAIALLSASPREDWTRRALWIAKIGVYAYLMAMAFMPPSVFLAIHESTNASAEKWSLESFAAIAGALIGWTILRHLFRCYSVDWRVQFFAYFAWLACSVPLAADYLHRVMMPQPGRYKFEMELGIALVAAFGGAALLRRAPVSIRAAIVFLLLALAAEQIVGFRKMEKSNLFPKDVTNTVEYRASTWAARNLPGVRVLFPGSLAQWANAFTDIQQFTGGSWSMATNQSQQKAFSGIVFEPVALDPDFKISLTWLKAYGAGAVAVSGANSSEFWKPFSDPKRFDHLPALWTDSGVTIRQVPLRSTSLAHVVPEWAIVRHPPNTPEDIGEAARYVTALEDPSLPLATLEWRGEGQMRIHANAAPGQVISVQEGYHPGWRATVGGAKREIFKDGLGLMWLRPQCNGACEIVLDYTGSWELWISRVVSYAAIVGLIAALVWRRRRSSDRAR